MLAPDLVWQRLILPLASRPTVVTTGPWQATLSFTPVPVEPSPPDGAPRHVRALVELRRDGPTGLDDLVQIDGAILGVAYADDASAPVEGPLDERLRQLERRWEAVVTPRLTAWASGDSKPWDVWPEGLYDAAMRCVLEQEAPSFERPAPAFDPLGSGPRAAAADLHPVARDLEDAAWVFEVRGWRWTACPETSFGTAALLLRAPGSEDLPVVLDDRTELMEGPGLPEPTLRALLTWLAHALTPHLGPAARAVLFRDEHRLHEPLDWSTDPGIVCGEPFASPELASRARSACERFIRDVLTGNGQDT